MPDNLSEKLLALVGAVMAAVGAIGLIAPNRVGPYLTDVAPADEAAYLTQMWTMRELAMGLVMLGARKSRHRRGVLTVAMALAVAEGLVVLRAPTLSRRTRSRVVGSAVAFTTAGAYGLVRERQVTDGEADAPMLRAV